MPRDDLKAAMLACLRAGHLADSVIQHVARANAADLPAVVAAMWELIDDGEIDYTSGARLVLLDNPEGRP